MKILNVLSICVIFIFTINSIAEEFIVINKGNCYSVWQNKNTPGLKKFEDSDEVCRFDAEYFFINKKSILTAEYGYYQVEETDYMSNSKFVQIPDGKYCELTTSDNSKIKAKQSCRSLLMEK
jgi:hypothetical protein